LPFQQTLKPLEDALEAPLDRRSLPEMEHKLLSTGLSMLFAAIDGHPTERALKRLFGFLRHP
jgi:hypothetical protein